jgi:hypothetical protein
MLNTHSGAATALRESVAGAANKYFFAHRCTISYTWAILLRAFG